MNWRLFLKSNKAMLLTLPGAALWSLPVGIVVWTRIQRFAPGMGLSNGLIDLALYVTLFLTPAAAVCSFLAMEIYSESKSNPGTSVMLMIFNQITAVLATLGTIGIVIELVGRLLSQV